MVPHSYQPKAQFVEMSIEKFVHRKEKILSADTRKRPCEAIKKFGVDVLVIESHDYGTIKRALLGSVSDYCAIHAKCPVLIVKKLQH